MAAIFAYLIDGLVGSLVVLALLAAADLDTVDAAGCPSDVPGGRTCIDLPGDDTDDTMVLADRGPLVAAVAVGFGWVLLNDVVLQGLTERDRRQVRDRRPGRPPRRSAPRAVARLRPDPAAADRPDQPDPAARPVGGDVLRGHRRIGDMVAATYVVKAGTPASRWPSPDHGAQPRRPSDTPVRYARRTTVPAAVSSMT